VTFVLSISSRPSTDVPSSPSSRTTHPCAIVPVGVTTRRTMWPAFGRRTTPRPAERPRLESRSRRTAQTPRWRLSGTSAVALVGVHGAGDHRVVGLPGAGTHRGGRPGDGARLGAPARSCRTTTSSPGAARAVSRARSTRDGGLESDRGPCAHRSAGRHTVRNVRAMRPSTISAGRGARPRDDRHDSEHAGAPSRIEVTSPERSALPTPRARRRPCGDRRHHRRLDIVDSESAENGRRDDAS
jgi:hypothetical protein